MSARSWWGWGTTDRALPDDECVALAGLLPGPPRRGRPGSEVAMWDDVKAAATEVLGRLGATITHHHAVGRDHRRGYDRQRPEPFAVALRAAKAALDPAGILNPGVLVDPV